jgi:N-acetylglucosamine kinase-like BadF-type ATPase
MTLLVADAGGTKAEWRFVHHPHAEAATIAFRTDGFNANLEAMSAMERRLTDEVLPRLPASPDKVFFYGAAFSTDEYCTAWAAALKRALGAKTAMAEHDLLGAARAAAHGKPAVVCILGTGSNSCFFDGQNIVAQRGGHGYIFGDHGSGADIGKRLLADILDGDAPAEIVHAFTQTYGPPKSVRSQTYRHPKPSVFLASLVPFIVQHPTPYTEQLVSAAFSDFLERTVMRLCRPEPVRFVGSLAKQFDNILLNVCAAKNIRVGGFVPNPIEALVEYHLRREESPTPA